MRADEPKILKPELPPFHTRTGTAELRRIGDGSPLSPRAGTLVSVASWLGFRGVVAFTDLGFPGDEIVVPGVIAVLFGTWLFRAFTHNHHRLIFDRRGKATLLAKKAYQRPRDEHVIWIFDTRLVEVEESESWWRASTLSVDGMRFALLRPNETVPRVRKILANPTGPMPPIIRARSASLRREN